MIGSGNKSSLTVDISGLGGKERQIGSIIDAVRMGIDGGLFARDSFSCFEPSSSSTAPTGAVMTFPSTVKILGRDQSARDRKR